MSSTTRQAVMQLLTELAKHAEPDKARLYKQAKSIHTLVTSVGVFSADARTGRNAVPAGFKQGPFFSARIESSGR